MLPFYLWWIKLYILSYTASAMLNLSGSKWDITLLLVNTSSPIFCVRRGIYKRYILSQFLTPIKKIVRGTPVPKKDARASKIWPFSSACKNLGAQQPFGAEIWPFEKGFLGGYILTFTSPWLLDQSSPDFFLTREEFRWKMHLFDFEYHHPFWRYLPSKFEFI